MEKFNSILTYYLDAPDIFIETAGYHVISSLFGRFFKCSCLPGKHGSRPNTWFIVSSIPGRTRRSTLAAYTTYLYRRSSDKFYKEAHRVKDKDAERMTLDTIIEEGTPEGIVDHINSTGLDAYTIMSSEFGSVLKNMTTKEWQAGVATLFSKMYSGEPYTFFLSQRSKDNKQKRYIEEDLYVTMFAGMQEPYLYLTPETSRQGLLRRVMLIYCEPSDITRWMAPLDFGRENIFEDLRDLSDEIHKRMIDYRDKSMKLRPAYLDITFYPDAMNIINDYAKIHDENLRATVSNINIYRQSFWEHYAKLAMLHCISRNGIDLVRGKWRANVSKEDVKKAMVFLDKATKYSADIISNLGRTDEPIRTARAPLERVYTIIHECGDNGIKRKDLYKKLHIKAVVLEELLRTLILEERIQRIEDVATNGRPKVVYKITV